MAAKLCYLCYASASGISATDHERSADSMTSWIKLSRSVNLSIERFLRLQPCEECGDATENWVCLGCYAVHCGRFVQVCQFTIRCNFLVDEWVSPGSLEYCRYLFRNMPSFTEQRKSIRWSYLFLISPFGVMFVTRMCTMKVYTPSNLRLTSANLVMNLRRLEQISWMILNTLLRCRCLLLSI